MSCQKRSENSGVANLIVVLGLAAAAVVLPLLTKLVQQRQEVRKEAMGCQWYTPRNQCPSDWNWGGGCFNAQDGSKNCCCQKMAPFTAAPVQCGGTQWQCSCDSQGSRKCFGNQQYHCGNDCCWHYDSSKADNSQCTAPTSQPTSRPTSRPASPTPNPNATCASLGGNCKYSECNYQIETNYGQRSDCDFDHYCCKLKPNFTPVPCKQNNSSCTSDNECCSKNCEYYDESSGQYIGYCKDKPSATATPIVGVSAGCIDLSGNCRFGCEDWENDIGKKSCATGQTCCVSVSSPEPTITSYPVCTCSGQAIGSFRCTADGSSRQQCLETNDNVCDWRTYSCPAGCEFGACKPTPMPTNTPLPTNTPKPTSTPKPTNTLVPNTPIPLECEDDADCPFRNGYRLSGCFGWPRKCVYAAASPTPAANPIPTSTSIPTLIPTIPPADPACVGKASGDCCGGTFICLSTTVGKLSCHACPTGQYCAGGQGCKEEINFVCKDDNLMSRNLVVETCLYGCLNGKCNPKPDSCLLGGREYSPGHTRCSSTSSYAICENGSWLTRNCPANHACTNNHCQPISSELADLSGVCTSGDNTCLNGEIWFTCNSEGKKEQKLCPNGCNNSGCIGDREVEGYVNWEGWDRGSETFEEYAGRVGMKGACADPERQTECWAAMTSPLWAAGGIVGAGALTEAGAIAAIDAAPVVMESLARGALTAGPVITKTGVTAAEAATGLLKVGVPGYLIVRSYENLSGDVNNPIINEILEPSFQTVADIGSAVGGIASGLMAVGAVSYQAGGSYLYNSGYLEHREQETIRLQQEFLDERNKQLTEYIDEGIQMIANGDYTNARAHFRDDQAARSFGIELDDPQFLGITNNAGLSDDRYNLAVNREMGDYSWFFLPREDNPSFDKLGKIQLLDLGFVGVEPPSRYGINSALLSAEEWTHALQHARGGVLAMSGEQISQISQIPVDEIDVALYILKKGVNLTPEFLEAHSRNMYLNILRP